MSWTTARGSPIRPKERRTHLEVGTPNPSSTTWRARSLSLARDGASPRSVRREISRPGIHRPVSARYDAGHGISAGRVVSGAWAARRAKISAGWIIRGLLLLSMYVERGLGGEAEGGRS